MIALTGNYGDGKTSVLNLLSKTLGARKDVVCVRFSTWLPMDQKTLVSTLFSTVLAELETKLFVPKIKRDLAAVTRLLFAVLPKVPAPLTDLIEKPSQEQQIADRLLRYEIVVDKDKVEQAFRDRMTKKYGPGTEFSFFPVNIRADITPLGRWALCGPEGQKQASDYLAREFRSGHWKIGRFLSYFFPLREGPPGIDSLTAVKIYFSPERLRELLDEYGDSSASSPEESQAVREFRARYTRGAT